MQYCLESVTVQNRGISQRPPKGFPGPQWRSRPVAVDFRVRMGSRVFGTVWSLEPASQTIGKKLMFRVE